MGRKSVRDVSGAPKEGPLSPHWSTFRSMAPALATRMDPQPPAPFLKWAGGKTQLLGELFARLPVKFATYHEPFLGSGALFFALSAAGRIRRARLCDGNAELMNAFHCVRDSVEEVLRALAEHTPDSEHFYEVRAVDPRALTPVERAARLIYLNRTCFNGLYRENSKGRFNVPYGRYTNPRIVDAPRLRAASRALASVELAREPFELSMARARRGDLVYLDPPYVPASRSSSFTAYSAGGFGMADQRRLADEAVRLAGRGVHVVLSNSDTPLVHELYPDCLVERVQASRAINSKGARRGKVWEVIVRPRVASGRSAASVREDLRTLSLPGRPV